MKEKGITQKEVALAENFLLSSDISFAAVQVGLSVNAARQTIKRPAVVKYLEDRQREFSERIDITREKVLQQYAKLGFFDTRELFDESGNVKPVTEWSAAAGAAVAGIEIEQRADTFEVNKDGTFAPVMTRTAKIKLKDTKSALDSIVKIMGWNAPERRELTGADGTPLFEAPDLSKLSREELQQFIALSEKIK